MQAKYHRVNPFCETLTLEKYRSFPGNENLSDEQAQEEIRSLTALADVLFDYLRSVDGQSCEQVPQIGIHKKIAA